VAEQGLTRKIRKNVRGLVMFQGRSSTREAAETPSQFHRLAEGIQGMRAPGDGASAGRRRSNKTGSFSRP